MTFVPFRSRSLSHSLVASFLVLAACTSDPQPATDLATTTTQVGTSVATDAPIGADTTTTTTQPEAAVDGAIDDPSPVCGATVLVVFDEGAPRDRMTITNVSEAAVDFEKISIDLTTSTGRLIFDTTDGGDGVEVFQAFQVESGDAVLAADPVAVDGGSMLDLSFASFGAGQSFTFSIDVDDQLENSDLGQIQVTGAEIEGASINVELTGGSSLTAMFASDSTASGAGSC